MTVGAADVPPGASPCDDTSNLRVGEIAMDLGVTPQYLGHIFKAAVGKTPISDFFERAII